ncbi:MAG TPA: GreA/GreB family elongation factor [Rubrivivax sp.]|nr:GreA/GreB family elongation factor [Rubrivivax sp.]HPO21022.1 GreA/GreB family elongation factor [Rubrivivax sp.]
MEALALERTLTELDHVRLCSLLRRGPRGTGSSAQREVLEPLLDACAIVPSRQVPPDVVTMYSQLELRDLDSGRAQTLTLCYPADAAPAAGRVSVLSPVGASLLGLTVGSVARWCTPAGEERQAEVAAIGFQPEAAGDYSK